MKTILVIFVLLIVQSLNLFGQSGTTPHIDIKYVGSGIATIIAVKYQKFDSAFASEQYKYKTINKEDDVFNKIEKSYKGAKYKISKVIDTRYKLTFYFSNSIKPFTIYSSYFYDFTLNGRIMIDCKFKKLLKEIIDSLNPPK